MNQVNNVCSTSWTNTSWGILWVLSYILGRHFQLDLFMSIHNLVYIENDNPSNHLDMIELVAHQNARKRTLRAESSFNLTRSSFNMNHQNQADYEKLGSLLPTCCDEPQFKYILDIYNTI